ncbi:flagellar assembly protein FliW [Aneurinibacillus tyrosinisolvens]|uniref:flagellar assembly protein FliW n=1 Tax=Aneurinibacillus tyrosinisolvens TaxID=1443435 RepID=UPI0006993D9D|nr:flagellar assembly protein FliW [Aneurinibacillus tyrosinisolvens]
MSFKMTSSLFGEVEYKENEVYRFEQGLPGFMDKRDFIFLTIEDSPFTVLHSIEEDLYFFLMDPFTLFSDYEFTIPDHVIEQLQIENRDAVICHSIAVLRDPLTDSTVNLAAPVIVNTTNRKGLQLVLENSKYSVRQPIFLGEEKSGYNTNENVTAEQDEAAANEQR